MPLNVANAREHTIDTTWIDEVYNSFMDPNNDKHFCSLSLTVTMDMCKYQKNLPKAHIVFKASNFQTSDDWHDQEERDWWYPRVVVSFH